MQTWQDGGGLLRNFTSLKAGVKDLYYRATYQKFHAFLLTDFARVVVMDADGFPLKNLDHLFFVKFPPGVKVAAPQAYWFSNKGVYNRGEVDSCPGK